MIWKYERLLSTGTRCFEPQTTNTALSAHYLNQIDYVLGHIATARLLGIERTMSLKRIGTAGWSIPKKYAKEFSAKETHLERYSRILSCAEINSTFYRSHRISTYKKWAESVPESFRFSVKAPKTITHEANLICGPDPLKYFLAEVNNLGTSLGPILFQLPPKAAFNSTVAEAFFNLLREQHSGPAVLEPRHPSWFTSQATHLMKKFYIARVAADPAITPVASAAAGWDQLLYCRLHGSPHMYYSSYPESYLQTLAMTLARQQAKEIWCIFDNTASGAAFGNAQTLAGLANDATNH
jgi:uncharacterized protein YecE (DUF72 family)